MARLNELKANLKPGQVYRRTDLTKWSKSVDRHLDILVKEGTLNKLAQGVYHYPKATAFGAAPAEEEKLVRSFLKDDRFLLTSPDTYNGLQVGTTQLYNKRVVYNHKRHGDFRLGNRTFSFRVKPHFPKKLTPEFLIVDLLNNLETLAEDRQEVLKNVALKVKRMNTQKLARSVVDYGSVKTKKLLQPLLASAELHQHAR